MRLSEKISVCGDMESRLPYLPDVYFFSISGRLNGGIAYERHILSAVSDHYYLTYFVLPIVLLSCFSFIDDDGEPAILRFQSYHLIF